MFYLGFARHVLDELITYVGGASRDGRRLADDPLVRDRIARLDLELAAGMRLAIRTLRSIESGAPDPALPPMAKVYATELLQRLAQAATEIAGTRGSCTRRCSRSRRRHMRPRAGGSRSSTSSVCTAPSAAAPTRCSATPSRSSASASRGPGADGRSPARHSAIVDRALERGRGAEPLAWHNTEHLPRLVFEAFSATDHMDALDDGARTYVCAITERDGGARLDAIATRAVRAADGSWTLSGAKCFVPGAADVDVLVVVARADDGLGVFTVARDSPGVTITPLPTIGLDEQCDIALDATPATLLADGCRRRARDRDRARRHRALRRRGGRGHGRARSHRRPREGAHAVGRADRLVPGRAAPLRRHADRRHHRARRGRTTPPVPSTAARTRSSRRHAPRRSRSTPAGASPPPRTSSTAARASTPTSPSTSGTGGSRPSSRCTAPPTSTAPVSPPRSARRLTAASPVDSSLLVRSQHVVARGRNESRQRARGRPRPRSAMRFFWISLVPPAVVKIGATR